VHFCNHCCSGKAISITYRKCVCVCRLLSSMQCACAILSPVACPALQYFSTLSHKRHDFRKKVTEQKMCVLISSTNFVWSISHSKKNWARYDQKYLLVFVCITRYSCPIVRKLAISRQFFKKIQIRPVEDELFLADRRTGMTKLLVIFSNFAKARKNSDFFEGCLVF
jgi:hypothetical protein